MKMKLRAMDWRSIPSLVLLIVLFGATTIHGAQETVVFRDIRKVLCGATSNLKEQLTLPHSAFKIRRKSNATNGVIEEWVLVDEQVKQQHGLRDLLIRIKNDRVDEVYFFTRDEPLARNLARAGLDEKSTAKTSSGKLITIRANGSVLSCGHEMGQER